MIRVHCLRERMLLNPAVIEWVGDHAVAKGCQIGCISEPGNPFSVDETVEEVEALIEAAARGSEAAAKEEAGR